MSRTLGGGAASRAAPSAEPAADEVSPATSPRPVPLSLPANASETDESPFGFLCANSFLIFFDEDLLDATSLRVKLNNVAAMAQGMKLVTLSREAVDADLRVHFAKLAARNFESALTSNPTAHEACRELAFCLLAREAHSLGLASWTERGCIKPIFWSSSLRYVDFLFRVALESNPYDSLALHGLALFLYAGGCEPRKVAWLLLRALLCDHDAPAMALLQSLLEELGGFETSCKLLKLWGQGSSPKKSE